MAQEKNSTMVPSGPSAWILKAQKHPLKLLFAVTIACLIPFLWKPFHIDDPMYIWTAQHIQAHPFADFYGHNANWYDTEMPVSQIQQNPPLVCYFMAVIGHFFGWSEPALHLAFLLPALAVIMGTYRIAQKFVTRPLLAGALALATPAFLVSSTSVMCDVTMLAFWVWSIDFWLEGLKRNENGKFLISGLLITLAELTKYYGVALVPLLFCFTLIQKRRLGVWVLCLMIPIAALDAYQELTRALYGGGLLTNAATYASGAWSAGQIYSRLVVGLAAVGGYALGFLCFTPMLWSRLRLTLLFAASILLVLPLCWFDSGDYSPLELGHVRWVTFVQLVLFILGGASLVAFTIQQARRTRNAQEFLLLLWIWGTIIFGCFINWAINARAFLPLIPAVAILLAGRLKEEANRKKILVPLAISGVISLGVAAADMELAQNGKTAAYQLHRDYAQKGRLWFEGHWAFQYYMQQLGATPLDRNIMGPAPGDLVFIPNHDPWTFPVGDSFESAGALEIPAKQSLSSFNRKARAGFYWAWGPLPYSFEPADPEKYLIFQASKPVDWQQSRIQHLKTLIEGGKTDMAVNFLYKGRLIDKNIPGLFAQLAWALATNPRPELRDGFQALQLAQRAAHLTKLGDPTVLDTLAAAYAETDQWPQAIRTVKAAKELAETQGKTALAEALQLRLSNYQSHNPWRTEKL